MIKEHPHYLLTTHPLQAGQNYISPPIPLDGYNSIRGWVYTDKECKLAIMQSFGRNGEYRKVCRDLIVTANQLGAFNIPVLSKYGLIIVSQGKEASTELECLLSLSKGEGRLNEIYNIYVT